MPPWLPEPGYGHFAGEQRLTDEQVRTIQEWVTQGAPEGTASGLPAAPKVSGNWELGKPDLILELPRPYVLPATGDRGRDVFRNFIVRVPVETKRYVRAIELRPSNPGIFHHAKMLVDRQGGSRRRETELAWGLRAWISRSSPRASIPTATSFPGSPAPHPFPEPTIWPGVPIPERTLF
jgi:hypothetical protein